MNETLIIVGASARGTAMSARRSGFTPWTADLFADLDLQACCEARRVESYPDGIESVAAEAPAGPWMYVGALENYPDLVDRIAAKRPLLGNQGAALRAVRDPFRLAAALSAVGFAMPRSLPISSDVPLDGSWLIKPFASAGGSRIRSWRGPETAASSPVDCYLQERIHGPTLGAVYVANGTYSRLLGLTVQSPESYKYRGSMGPYAVSPEVHSRFEQLGSAIAAAFGLRGLFGVDAILANDEIYPLEVNPRYTASVEILERIYGWRSIKLHVAGCRGEPLDRIADFATATHPLAASAGKTILYADADFVVSSELAAWAELQNRDSAWPAVADIPSPGSRITAGHPILTVLAAGRDLSDVREILGHLAAQTHNLIGQDKTAANRSGAKLS